MKDIAKAILASVLTVAGLVGTYFNVDGALLALIGGLWIGASLL